jgi:hypothetical protein
MPTHTIDWENIKSSQEQVEITVDCGLGHVTITDINDDSLSIFLQSNEGYQFIDQAKSTYNENGDLSMDDAYHLHAYEYLDLLYHG